MTTQRGSLFLLPSPIQENDVDSIPPVVIRTIHALDYFIVEKARTARRYVSATNHPGKIDELIFEELPESWSPSKEIERLLSPAHAGKNIGLMSEAGLPAIADPGSFIIRQAHVQGIKVVALSGPSSIMMALMASGLEGQRFAFHGYLSAKRNELASQMKDLERRCDKDDATQIFIETPYRNRQIMEVAAEVLDKQRQFCIAADLGSENGFVLTQIISLWIQSGWPEIHKIPAVFLLR